MNKLYPYHLRAFREKETKDLRVTSSRVRYSLIAVLVVLLVIYIAFELEDRTMEISLFIILGIFFINQIWAFFEWEYVHQEEIGTAVFQVEKIEIKLSKLNFKWKDVMQVGYGSVKGENIFSWVDWMGPRYSAGQDAFLKFKSDSKTTKIHLQFETQEDQQTFRDVLIDQYIRGNVRLKTVYIGLGLGYKQIQEIKRMRKVQQVEDAEN